MAKVTQEQLMHCTICNKGTRPLGRDKKTFWLMRLIPTIVLTMIFGQSGFYWICSECGGRNYW